MAGYVLVGALAAFGLLSVLWAVLGWLLPDGKGMVLVCAGVPQEGILSRFRWLRGMGFLRCPLVAVTEEPVEGHSRDYELCSREALLDRLEQEHCHGTGIGDPSGRHQRRGISEL